MERKLISKSRFLVLDTWAVVCFLRDQPAAARVSECLAEASEKRIPLSMSAVNVGELWYALRRHVQESEADQALTDLANLGIEFVPADLAMAREAAWLKDKYRISLGDAFAASLARLSRAELVTGDPDFKQIKEIELAWVG